MSAVTICSDFGGQIIKSGIVSTFPLSICHEVLVPDAMIFIFWMLSFKPAFSTLLFHPHQDFSSSLFSAIRVLSYALLIPLIFLPEILILAYVSSSPALHMVYSAYKVNKQGDNRQPWCTPFSIWNQFFVPWPVLTFASWLAYKFLRRQVRWSAIPISFKNFP